MTVRIVTDSTCDLPADVVKRLNIHVVPIYIRIGQRDYQDGIDLTRDEFYAKLPHLADHPTTAVPSPHLFRAMYDSLADEGTKEVLSIHISASLSAIVDVAQTAAAETTSLPVTVFDSRQLSMGMGFLVETAAELALAGLGVEEILTHLEAQTKRTQVWALLDTLKYLRRSGRMNGVVSTIGELMQIKPILKMHDGQSNVEKVRTRKRGVSVLEQRLGEFGPFEKIAFLHSGALDEAQALADRICHLLPGISTGFGIINPVLGAHLGTGVVGFASVSAKKEA